MAKRKRIKVHHGDVSKLATMCKVSPRTVYSALRWNADTINENLVREYAMKYFVKQF